VRDRLTPRATRKWTKSGCQPMIADRLTQFSRRDYPGIDFYLN
jgi:hypothetical protein